MTGTEIFCAKEITRGLRLASCLRKHIQTAVRYTGVCEYSGVGDLSLSTTFTRPLSTRCGIRASGKDIGKHGAVQEE